MYVEADFRVRDRADSLRSVYRTVFEYTGNDLGSIERISYDEFRDRRHYGEFDTSANIYDVAESMFDYYWIETDYFTDIGDGLAGRKRIRNHNRESIVSSVSEVTEILDMEKLADRTEVILMDAELVQDT